MVDLLNPLAIDQGFAEVYSDTVAILTEAAIEVEKIDLNAVKEAQERAQKALDEADDSIDPRSSNASSDRAFLPSSAIG